MDNTTIGTNVTLSSNDITSILEHYIYGVCIPIVAIPGILLSLLSVVVFSHKSMRSSLNVYLAGLSVFDFLLLSMALSIYPPIVQCTKNHHSGFWCDWLSTSVLVTFPVSLVAQFGSVWTCVLLTVDRFLVIKYPLQSRIWCTTTRSFYSLVILTTCAVIYRLPSAFELKRNDMGLIVETQLRKSKLYHEIYHTWFYLAFLFLIPWSLMLILNVILAHAVRRASIKRKVLVARGTLREKREHRCTIIAIIIIVSFIIFNSAAVVNHCLENFFGQGTPGTPYFILRRSMIFLGNLLICVNSASNFIIYCLGAGFRKQCARLLLPCITHNPLLEEIYSLSVRRTSFFDTSLSFDKQLNSRNPSFYNNSVSESQRRQSLVIHQRNRFDSRKLSVALVKQNGCHKRTSNDEDMTKRLFYLGDIPLVEMIEPESNTEQAESELIDL